MYGSCFPYDFHIDNLSTPRTAIWEVTGTSPYARVTGV
jgi:hypothetical protein